MKLLRSLHSRGFTFHAEALLVALGFVLLAHASAQTVTVAAAADLANCGDELGRAFNLKDFTADIRFTTGASGSIFAQIKNGAPFDLFMSADTGYPKKLIELGLADKESLTTYGFGHLVLWTPRSDLDVKAGLVLLRNPAIGKVAIANTETAPYGRAARSALEHEGLWVSIQPKLVFGENVSQTLEFVKTGNADAGLVALSLILNLRAAGQYYEVPEGDYPPIEQSMVLTSIGAKNPAARAYLAFLKTPQARAIFERYGFRLASKAE